MAPPLASCGVGVEIESPRMCVRVVCARFPERLGRCGGGNHFDAFAIWQREWGVVLFMHVASIHGRGSIYGRFYLGTTAGSMCGHGSMYSTISLGCVSVAIAWGQLHEISTRCALGVRVADGVGLGRRRGWVGGVKRFRVLCSAHRALGDSRYEARFSRGLCLCVNTMYSGGTGHR